MCLYIHFGSFSIPSYGLLIALGVIIANLAALFVLKKTQLDFNDFIILEAYCFLGAFIGSKLLYLIVSFQDIDWKKMTDPSYFNAFMQSGFVFYGGLILGLAFIFIAGKIHHINPAPYIRNFVFLIPLIHCFGRVGCFMAGCCYGIPYDGIGAVVFPENSFALPGVKLFPIQLVEAGLLIIISAVLFLLQLKKNFYYTIEFYLISYGITRFILEYFRYDEIRGSLGILTTSQWLSIFLIAAAAVSIFYFHRSPRR